MRVKLIKSHKLGRKGDTLEVTNNVGFGLIDSGFGELTKDIAPDDYKQAGDKDGKPTFVRPNKFK